MNTRPDPSPAEDDLFEFATDPGAKPVTGLHRTFRRLQRATNSANQKMPPDLRQHIWEDIMTTTTTASRLSRDVLSGGSPALHPPGEISAPSLESRLARWQPAVSLGIVVAFLVGLVAFAYERGVLDDGGLGPGFEPNSSAGALVLVGTPAPDECIAQPTQLSDEELASYDISDWREPAYFVTNYADPETAEAIRQTVNNRNACLDGTTEFDPTAEYVTYFSDRQRYVWLYESLSPEQQAGIDAFYCRPKEDDVLRFMPLPVNRQNLPWPGDLNPDASFESADVYILGDGRYATVLGTITTDTLRDPDSVDTLREPESPQARDWIFFAAFIEQDGFYYLDEGFYAFVRDPACYSPGQKTGHCD